MNKIIFILAIVALVFSSCGGQKKKAEVGTHPHEDGSIHANDAHSHDATAKPKQESFEVKPDSDSDHEAEHKHESGDEDHSGHEHEANEHTHEDGATHGDHDH
jgi:hypothetical protein